MDDAHGYDERESHDEGAGVSVNGDYLYIQHPGQLRYIYRRVEPDAEPHPLISHRVYESRLYRLAWVEDEKEFG